MAVLGLLHRGGVVGGAAAMYGALVTPWGCRWGRSSDVRGARSEAWGVQVATVQQGQLRMR